MGSVKPKLEMKAILLLMLVLSGLAVKAGDLDYWEKSPELWSAMSDSRRIYVSAKNEGDRTYSKGAGFVNAEVPKVWAFATNPEKIKTASRFLKDFTWDPVSGDVSMQIEILFISHRLKGKAEKRPDAENPRISFRVLEGSLVPFEADLEIRSAKAQARRAGAPGFSDEKSLVRISGVSAEGRALNWPMRVGLEALLQRTAGALREAVENEK